MQRQHRCRLLLPALGSLLAVLLGPLTSGDARASAELFGTRQVYFADLDPFTKWNEVVARTEHQIADPRELCPNGLTDRGCVLARWRAFVAAMSRLPLAERVARVNSALNGVRYVPTAVNWHDGDHWETPFEFLEYGGQCEDFAIAKLVALSQTGVAERDLRLVVVWDEVKRLPHAVAVVYVDGKALVLDNQIKEVMPDTEIGRYVPYYAINRQGWWLSVAADGAPPVRREVSP
ncbi:MAG TPA: transglutaminase-like cysteine peptidase [Stellaceae bacterium]|nr:transglutaminase-like cysteine peptidase [Stellaceae bacterium]